MRVFTRFFFSASLLFAFFLVPISTYSQTADTGVVRGTVSDKAGAVVPDASATLTNTGTNESKTVATNSSGEYVFPNVAPGNYNLKISKAGFAVTSFPTFASMSPKATPTTLPSRSAPARKP